MLEEDVQYDYSFDVLLEQVSEEDLFEDKTHERVAETLNSLMTTTKNGLTIGLEGSWGSGKSTVINILRQKLLTNDKKVFFFAFDAWAHDGVIIPTIRHLSNRIKLRGLVSVLA